MQAESQLYLWIMTPVNMHEEIPVTMAERGIMAPVESTNVGDDRSEHLSGVPE